MSKTCTTCSAEIADRSKKSSAWLPLLTAVGVSAAAILVFRQVRKAKDPIRISRNALEHCARAARDLDRRLDEGVQFAS